MPTNTALARLDKNVLRINVNSDLWTVELTFHKDDKDKMPVPELFEKIFSKREAMEAESKKRPQ